MSPRLIFTLLSSELREVTRKQSLPRSEISSFTDQRLVLELYLSRSFGFTLLILSALTAILQNAPLDNTLSESTSSEAPYAFPTLIVTLVYHVGITLFSYSSWLHTKQMSLVLNMSIYSILAALGGWCLLFGGDGGRHSRRTGADKRTSGFPFKNAEADKRKVGKRN